MGKNIVIVGTMDTKGEQLMMLKEMIARFGHQPLLMDLSMGGKSGYAADIGPEEIAALAGKSMADIFAENDRSQITKWMTAGAIAKASVLLSENLLDGVVSIGGMSIALISAQIMSTLPFGIPKVIGTTAAMPVYVGKLFGAADIAVMQLILEIAGKNDLIRNAVSQVAGAVCGMVEASSGHRNLKLPKPSIAITQLGFSDRCAKNVERLLEENGYHVFPFHAQGISDMAMDKLIGQGFFDGVIEIVPAGLIEAQSKGNRAADMTRLDAACERGIPQVWAPCCLNITGAGPTRVNREKYEASGRVFKMDAMRAMARFPRDELEVGAKLYAEKLNKAKGPVKLVVPLKGWSSIDNPGSVLFDPDEDRRFIELLKKNLVVPVEIEEVDANLEDVETAEVLVNSLDTMMRSGS